MRIQGGNHYEMDEREEYDYYQGGHGVYGDEHANRLKKVVYPPRLMVDFTNLGFDALKRYAQFYNLNIRDEYDEEELAAVVARHFDCSLEVDEDESIVSFIQRVRNGEKSSSSKRSSEKDRNKDKKRKKSNSRKRQRDSASSSSHSAPTSSSNKKESSKKKEDASEDNELYCICNLPSYGNMIACDGKKCPNPSQWYHLECVGLADGRHPDTWLCPECDPKGFANRKKKNKTRSKSPGPSSSRG